MLPQLPTFWLHGTTIIWVSSSQDCANNRRARWYSFPYSESNAIPPTCQIRRPRISAAQTHGWHRLLKQRMGPPQRSRRARQKYRHEQGLYCFPWCCRNRREPRRDVRRLNPAGCYRAHPHHARCNPEENICLAYGLLGGEKLGLAL